MVGLQWKTPLKFGWFGGTPISGNHHIYSFEWCAWFCNGLQWFLASGGLVPVVHKGWSCGWWWLNMLILYWFNMASEGNDIMVYKWMVYRFAPESLHSPLNAQHWFWGEPSFKPQKESANVRMNSYWYFSSWSNTLWYPMCRAFGHWRFLLNHPLINGKRLQTSTLPVGCGLFIEVILRCAVVNIGEKRVLVGKPAGYENIYGIGVSNVNVRWIWE